MYVIGPTDLCVGIQLSCLSIKVIWKKNNFLFTICVELCVVHIT